MRGEGRGEKRTRGQGDEGRGARGKKDKGTRGQGKGDNLIIYPSYFKLHPLSFLSSLTPVPLAPSPCLQSNLPVVAVAGDNVEILPVPLPELILVPNVELGQHQIPFLLLV